MHEDLAIEELQLPSMDEQFTLERSAPKKIIVPVPPPSLGTQGHTKWTRSATRAGQNYSADNAVASFRDGTGWTIMGRRSHRSRKDIKLKLVAEKHFRKQLMISEEGGGRHQQFSVPGCCECRLDLRDMDWPQLLELFRVGGRGSLTTFRRPLTESGADVDIEAGGMDRERSREEPGTSPKSNMSRLRPAAASGRTQNMGRQRSAQTAGEALVAAALSGAGRRLPGLGHISASSCDEEGDQSLVLLKQRLGDSWMRICRKMESECYAVCMAGGLDLAWGELGRSERAYDCGSQSSLAGPRQLDNGLGGGLVRHFGTGENIVLHLQFFGQKDVFAFGFGCIAACGFEEETMNFLFKRKDEVEADDGADDGDEPAQEEKLAHSYVPLLDWTLPVHEVQNSRPEDPGRNKVSPMCGMFQDIDILLFSHSESYWYERFEKIYVACRTYLDIDKRVAPLQHSESKAERIRFMNLLCTSWTEFTVTSKIVARTSAEDILNQRLVVLKVSHETRLEWIVIILILVEVVLEIIQLYFTPSG
ncbi:hypothetical protein AK812_SmicGene35907 [Symbiodinium microadriaticum]|uniref:DUF155 domain-containing protein n=1 Tax=Symbiodinium microadriaticum TaxID=2951 RepID=A0A1Q9CK83_SYMMI|nr:hypothetical protein AK812_SmicGene35907 [Symbiodinium microadriaticum]